MKPYISTESHTERANSRALSPVPFAAEPKDAPSMRYTGFLIGISCIRKQQKSLNFMSKEGKKKGATKVKRGCCQKFHLSAFSHLHLRKQLGIIFKKS